MDIKNNGNKFNEVAILQKCFCDIPFHKLGENFALNAVGDTYEALDDKEKSLLEKRNTHFDYYGCFAIGFSKKWGELNHLQPIHYLNNDSQYTKEFSALLESVFSDDDISDNYVQDIINRLTYTKPLRGIMKRKIKANDSCVDIEIYKNFHDEREWRYVPDASKVSFLDMENIIANPRVIKFYNVISDNLESEKFKDIWLHFSYDDIRYIIVPDTHERLNIINCIMDIPDDKFASTSDIEQQKYVLISKILVLNEIRKDW